MDSVFYALVIALILFPYKSESIKIPELIFFKIFNNPNMYERFWQRHYMKRVPGNARKEIHSQLDKMHFLWHKSN